MVAIPLSPTMSEKETIHPDRDTVDVSVAIDGETYDYHEGNMTV
jgi:hypothetical protein